MSLFGKQVEDTPPTAPSDGHGAYGIGDLIRLLKTTPIDHHPKLVVQVIKTTLESVGVKSEAVIQDALARENGIRDAIEMIQSQIIVLAQEIEARQNQIAELQVALRETTHARSLLAGADLPSESVPLIDLNRPQLVEASEVATDGGLSRALPPPLPPPRRKAASDQAHHPAQRG
jgi:hypothetical protein